MVKIAGYKCPALDFLDTFDILAAFQVSETSWLSKASLTEGEDYEAYSGYLETLFRLDGDMISAEFTGQAASLLTEKFSTGAKKLIHFSRLQWKASG